MIEVCASCGWFAKSEQQNSSNVLFSVTSVQQGKVCAFLSSRGVTYCTGSPLTGWYVSPDELACSAKVLKIDTPERSAVALA